MNCVENLDYFVCYRLDSISPAGVFSLEWNQLKKVQMPGKGAVWLVNREKYKYDESKHLSFLLLGLMLVRTKLFLGVLLHERL